MGIKIVDPGKAVPELECRACFFPYKTPYTLWCLITGIERGPFWSEPMGPPPNGTYPLTIFEPCGWHGGLFPWSIYYLAAVPGSGISIMYDPLWLGIWGFDVDNCESWFDLEADEALKPYFTNGFAVLAFTIDCPLISLSALAESVGLHPGTNLFAEGWALPERKAVFRFADVPESTNVKILLDCP